MLWCGAKDKPNPLCRRLLDGVADVRGDHLEQLTHCGLLRRRRVRKRKRMRRGSTQLRICREQCALNTLLALVATLHEHQRHGIAGTADDLLVLAVLGDLEQRIARRQVAAAEHQEAETDSKTFADGGVLGAAQPFEHGRAKLLVRGAHHEQPETDGGAVLDERGLVALEDVGDVLVDLGVEQPAVRHHEAERVQCAALRGLARRLAVLLRQVHLQVVLVVCGAVLVEHAQRRDGFDTGPL